MLVAAGLGDGRQTLLRHPHEMMLGGGGSDRVNGHSQAAVSAVLEPDREGEPRRQLAVQLRLRCPCANGTERDQVGQELWRDGVQHLAGDGHAARRQVAEQLP